MIYLYHLFYVSILIKNLNFTMRIDFKNWKYHFKRFFFTQATSPMSIFTLLMSIIALMPLLKLINIKFREVFKNTNVCLHFNQDWCGWYEMDSWCGNFARLQVSLKWIKIKIKNQWGRELLFVTGIQW